jgi:hypothetical protein
MYMHMYTYMNVTLNEDVYAKLIYVPPPLGAPLLSPLGVEWSMRIARPPISYDDDV